MLASTMTLATIAMHMMTAMMTNSTVIVVIFLFGPPPELSGVW